LVELLLTAAQEGTSARSSAKAPGKWFIRSRSSYPSMPSSLELFLSRTHSVNTIAMPFAQLVIGPPGSGKSTYCDGMQQFMTAIERKCSVVNLDPANDHTSYEPALDVRDLVTIDEIMEQETLGPNGGVLYALEELEQHFDWLEAGLKELGGP
jgi:GTPase SAR1 family protein